MRCFEAAPLLVPLLDGEIGRSEERLLLSHLERCPDCAARLDELDRSTPKAPVLELSADSHLALERAVEVALDQAVRKPGRRPRSPSTSWSDLTGAVWRELMSAELRIPRGVAVLYGVALVIAVLAATVRPWEAPSALPTSDSGEPIAWADGPSASYTPEDDWF